MTSRERVLTALNCREPDRIPFVEIAVDKQFGAKLLGKTESEETSPEVNVEEVVYSGPLFGGPGYEANELLDELGLDAI